MRQTFYRLYILLATLTLFFVACGNETTSTAQTSDRYNLGKPLSDSALVAIVTSEAGTDTLWAKDYTEHIQRLTRQFPQVMLDPKQADVIRGEIVSQFVTEHVILGEIKRRDIAVEPARIEDELVQYKTQFGSDSVFYAELAHQGQTEQELRDYLKKRIQAQLLQASIRDGVEAPAPEDAEAYRKEQSIQVRAQHILIGIDADTERDSLRIIAQTILDSVQAGTDFSELARRHSNDPGSAYLGGEMPFFKRGEMVKPFEEAAFALADSGDVSHELVETQFGYHIIRLLERKQDSLMNLEQAGTELLQKRQQEAETTLIKDLKTKAILRVNPDIISMELLK